ncbi:hypothetical protein CC1G_14919 [Coprinopsis cinerea okayama7|uniref:Uncharacterized protein n=1 Tax=Coprinopsis cinerea (strain Okayama-7 / 130 / ATCC MYA-4618 / FGSC 9003) TaxID=240176 RepID=D6RNY4_COPC7|nr:hypothetical protein CC1G_14919 [Coprinopsis cinerea okayama7\|eukprot:XP_002910941.1 hypothetical protein CC1G_14919 [Coprinopsis cinerea okayama7\
MSSPYLFFYLFFQVTFAFVVDVQHSHAHHDLAQRQSVRLCPAGSLECVGYCCIGDSCCSHGAEPCCIAGASCQVFDHAPLCCVKGVNCGEVLSSVAAPTPTSTVGLPPPQSSISSISSASIPTPSPSSTNSDEESSSNKLQLSDRIALGVGIAVGVPSALAAIIQMWKWRK